MAEAHLGPREMVERFGITTGEGVESYCRGSSLEGP